MIGNEVYVLIRKLFMGILVIKFSYKIGFSSLLLFECFFVIKFQTFLFVTAIQICEKSDNKRLFMTFEIPSDPIHQITVQNSKTRIRERVLRINQTKHQQQSCSYLANHQSQLRIYITYITSLHTLIGTFDPNF